MIIHDKDGRPTNFYLENRDGIYWIESIRFDDETEAMAFFNKEVAK